MIRAIFNNIYPKVYLETIALKLFRPESLQTVSFGSESDGFATGTEGFVVYASDVGDFRIGWDNPFIGSNGFGIATPPGFGGSHTDESGNNANVEVFLFRG